MSAPARTLFLSLVRPFYRENAGNFLFAGIVLFCIISKVDGAGLFEYHYSLALGMLKSNSYLLLVFFIWLLYARKCIVFVSGLLKQPPYAFIQIYYCLDKARQFRLFLLMEAMLLLPVILYALFVVVIGCQHHLFIPVMLIMGYILLLCIGAAIQHVHVLHHLHPERQTKRKTILKIPASYTLLLLRFVAHQQKMLWIGLKLFTCGILYMTARNNTLADYDTSFPFLFFNFGILANGIVIHRLREFEETRLAFYRGLPVSIVKRWLAFSIIYFVLILPECITTAWLTPVHLHTADAILFSLSGYSVLLLLNSISYLQHFSMKVYLKLLLLVFFVQYAFIISIGIAYLCSLFFLLAAISFAAGFYQFERSRT